MTKPITIRDTRGSITAQPERMQALLEARAAVKTPSVKAFRASVLRKADKRLYPRFVEGGNTAAYVASYERINSGLNLSGGEGYFQPLGTTPQYTPLFDGVEESCE